jgi:hypothetical protein
MARLHACTLCFTVTSIYWYTGRGRLATPVLLFAVAYTNEFLSAWCNVALSLSVVGVLWLQKTGSCGWVNKGTVLQIQTTNRSELSGQIHKLNSCMLHLFNSTTLGYSWWTLALLPHATVHCSLARFWGCLGNSSYRPTGIRNPAQLHLVVSPWSWSYFVADGQSTNLSWYQAPTWGPWSDVNSCQTFEVFILLGALPDERIRL